MQDGGDAEILARRCPDCEFRETVVVSVTHAARLFLAEQRVREEMLELADSLREIPVGP